MTTSTPSERLLPLLSFLARGGVLVVTGLLFVLGYWLISLAPVSFSAAGMAELSGGARPLDLLFAPSVSESRAELAQLGEAGRDAYRSFQLVDLFFPAVLAAFFAGALLRTYRAVLPLGAAVALSLLPVLGAALDYAEGVGVFVALQTYPDVPGALLAVVGILTTVKLVLLYLSLLLLVVGVPLALVLRTRRRSRAGAPTS